MPSVVSRAALIPLIAAACIPPDTEPKPGSQIGSLRDDEPRPPSDYKALDMAAVVEEALRLGATTTLVAAWGGHMATLEQAPVSCPAIWLGGLPEDLVDIDMEDGRDGMSWLANCTTEPGYTTFRGFSHWSASIEDEGAASRLLVADAQITAQDGTVLFDFDGEAADALDLSSGQYSSAFDGTLGGTLAGRALRTGGEFEAAWGPQGLRMVGTVTALDGFGPPDSRDPNPEISPELQNQPSWQPGMPRFTSVRFDLQFTEECAQEPVGFIGLRGNEGFWFDVYFLPIYDPDEDSFQSRAFPYEQIDNLACDGIGTLFARNVDLKEEDASDAAWSREIAPDFAGTVAALSTPTLEDFIYTLRQVTENP